MVPVLFKEINSTNFQNLLLCYLHFVVGFIMSPSRGVVGEATHLLLLVGGEIE